MALLKARKLMVALMVCCLATTLLPGSSLAAVEETGGSVVPIKPPASVELKALTSDSQIRVFDEQIIKLPQDLAVDISQPGTYGDTAALTPGFIPAGTPVCSHLVHYDLTPDAGGIRLSGTVRFDTQILGLMVSDAGLDSTDGTFGASGTVYPSAGLVYRGLELTGIEDEVTVGHYILGLDLIAYEVLDHIRVLTYGPEPALTWGDIADTGGAVVPVEAPPSVELKAYTSPVEIRVFNEQTVKLAQDLPVNISKPGIYTDQKALSPAIIPAGTAVNSHLLHFDLPPGVEGATLSGSVSFDNPIVGLIVLDGDLDGSDAALGAPGTVYPIPGIVHRGLELDPAEPGVDTLVVGSTTLDVVDVQLTAIELFDHVRILTAPVTEPVVKTVRDEFKTIAYNGNDGSAKWATDWVELGETDGPRSGQVRVVYTRACPAGNCLRIGGNEVNINRHGLWRGADLSGAGAARLSFDFRRRALTSGRGGVYLQISGDGGATWTTLGKYAFYRSDWRPVAQRFDISRYAGPDTRIRFLGAGEKTVGYMFIDNVQIEYKTGGVIKPAPDLRLEPTLTSAPRLVTDDGVYDDD